MTQTPTIDKRAVMAGHWLLRGLQPAELDRLLRHVRLERYAPDAVIFHKGDTGTAMMAVAEGRVKISAPSPDGRSVVLNIIDTGEMFGEVALLDGGERTGDATAMGATALLVLERRDFLPCLERHPELCIELMTLLCARLRRTSEQVEDLLFLVRPARLAKVLLRLADQYGTELADGVRIDLRMSQTELGALTGMTRESMNKQLAAWRGDGLIGTESGLITIHDRTRFQRLVDEPPD